MNLQLMYSSELIQARTRELGARISKDFHDLPLVAVCVLKGAAIFFADLVRSLSIETEMDFVRMSSYAGSTSSSGKVTFSKDMEIPIKDKHVLIVEDIVDTGLSVSYLRHVLEARNPLSIRICALIDKLERRQVQVKVHYPGFVLREGFIVGYGLDYAEKYRQLPGIFKLVSEK